MPALLTALERFVELLATLTDLTGVPASAIVESEDMELEFGKTGGRGMRGGRFSSFSLIPSPKPDLQPFLTSVLGALRSDNSNAEATLKGPLRAGLFRGVVAHCCEDWVRRIVREGVWGGTL